MAASSASNATLLWPYYGGDGDGGPPPSSSSVVHSPSPASVHSFSSSPSWTFNAIGTPPIVVAVAPSSAADDGAIAATIGGMPTAPSLGGGDEDKWTEAGARVTDGAWWLWWL